MLHLITGVAGSGRFKKMVELIKSQLDAGNGKVALIIPEQFSFETEKSILYSLGAKKANSVKVLSFSRLCQAVYKKAGSVSGERLSRTGRLILISEAIKETETENLFLRSGGTDKEFISMIDEIGREFKRLAISPGKLYDSAEKISDTTLQNKTRQIALICQAYDALVANGYLDFADDLTRLNEALFLYNYFEGYTVFFEFFDGFTAQEFDIIEHILKQAQDVYVGLCTDRHYFKDDGYELFSPVKETARSLIRLAEAHGIKTADNYELLSHTYFENEQLRIVEENVFRPNKKHCAAPAGNINLYEASDVYCESDFVARTIKRLVIQEGYRYRDFEVIARDIESYNGIIDAALRKYDVKYFIDAPQRVDEKPLMNFALTAFDIAHKKFDTDEILNLLKTDICAFTSQEIADLENYAFVWHIDKGEWIKEFTKNPKGLSNSFSAVDKERLEKINLLRERLITPLRRFATTIQSENAAGMARALYNLMTDLGVKERIVLLSKALREQGQFDLSGEQTRIYTMLMDALDQMVKVLGNKKITSKRFRELLELAINSQDIAFIPHRQDEVNIGSAGRTIIGQPKITFVIGANEGSFPRHPKNNTLFNYKERKKLKAAGVDLQTSLHRDTASEKYIAYKALCSASQKLYVSWCESALDGGEKTESDIVREIKTIFPGITTDNSLSFSRLDDVYSKRSGFETLSRTMRDQDEISASLYHIYMHDKDYAHKISALERAAFARELKFEDSAVSRKLFGERMRVSASQLEKYYSCPFGYFCRYGLLAKERKTAEFDALEYGSLVHYAFEKILKENEVKKLQRMDYKSKCDMMSRVFCEYIERRMGKLQDQDARFKYLFRRTINTAVNLLTHLVEELAQSDFVPFAMEMSIGEDTKPFTLQSKNGDIIEVVGKVDRVDLLKLDNAKYIRVIDYKTGSKDFKLSDILYGLNMQMLIYLNAICKNSQGKLEGALPAGVLYMPSANTVVTVGRDEDETDIEKKKNKKLKMNGLILENLDVVTAMEKQGSGAYIPVTVKGDKLPKSEYLADLEQMRAISKKTERMILQMSDAVKEGEVCALPVASKRFGGTACEYCPYSTACAHEEDDDFSLIEDMRKAQVLESIAEEEKKDET